jgi:hypothetical protein
VVTWRYQPPWFPAGLALATAVALACYAIGLFAAPRRSGPS